VHLKHVVCAPDHPHILVMEDDELARAEQRLHDILANTLDEVGEAEDLARQRAKQVCVW